jgi:hypothetical protein
MTANNKSAIVLNHRVRAVLVLSRFAFCGKKLLFCHSLGFHLSVRHFPGNLNLAFSRSLHPVNTEWEIHPAVCLKWDRPHIELFATRLNYKLSHPL